MNPIMFCQTLIWCETFSTFSTIEIVNLFCLAPVCVQMLLKVNFRSRAFTTMITSVFCAFQTGFVFLETLFRYIYMQMSHKNISVVWIPLLWPNNPIFVEQEYSHWSHWKKFSFQCTALKWLDIFPLQVKVLSHFSHWYGFSPVWVLTWPFSFVVSGNDFPQWGQMR